MGHANVLTDVLIELKDVSYKYPNGTTALDGVSMKIKQGDAIAILGPNGAGKTTLLTLIAGLIKPSSGSVEYHFHDSEHPIKKQNEIRKKIGIVFQDPDPALLSNSVYEEIAFGPLHLQWDKKEIIDRVDAMITLMNLEEVKNQHPFHLSEGEKKKVLLAAVLVMNPEVIIFDEPLINLDQETKEWFIEFIESLRQMGKTLIFATHNIDLIPYLAEEIYLVNKHLLGAGNAREILWDTKKLRETKLAPPSVVKIILGLEKMGFQIGNLCGILTLEELMEALSSMCTKVTFVTK